MVLTDRQEDLRLEEWRSFRVKIQKLGLLRRKYVFYFLTILSDLLLLTVGVGLLTLLSLQWWGVVIAGAFWSFACTRWAFLLHDAGHRQVFNTGFHNDCLGLFASFIVGGSYSFWMDAHNRHHSYPNDPERDPDAHRIVAGLISQTEAKGWFLGKFLAKHPIAAALLARTVTFLFIGIQSARFLWSGERVYYLKTERVIFLGHYLVATLGLALLVGPWNTLIFNATFFLVIGVYFATVFAPNHKGMAVFEKSENVEFLLLQTATTRDFTGGWLTEFFSGGLGHQLTHHLFPNMPRCSLPKAKPLVRDFLDKVDLPYYEATFVEAQKESFKVFVTNT